MQGSLVNNRERELLYTYIFITRWQIEVMGILARVLVDYEDGEITLKIPNTVKFPWIISRD